jgi:hypothetical protein
LDCETNISAISVELNREIEGQSPIQNRKYKSKTKHKHMDFGRHSDKYA